MSRLHQGRLLEKAELDHKKKARNQIHGPGLFILIALCLELLCTLSNNVLGVVVALSNTTGLRLLELFFDELFKSGERLSDLAFISII